MKAGAPALPQLDESNAWRVSGVRKAQAFFRALAALVPDATDVFLEGSPAADILALMQPHIAPTDYIAPAGTYWSWPQRNRRFRLKASPELFARLSNAAPLHAEPEICDHLHIYVESEPLVTWFDAFIEPVLVSKTIARDRVAQFCTDVGGVLADADTQG